MQIDFAAVLAYAFGLLLLYIVGRILIMPLRIVLKLMYNALIGGVVLLLLNFLGGYIGLHIALNPVTALVVGFLGVPGVVMLLVLQYILAG
ncbi:Pro-sigmaK processing inhibitor BofA [Tepidanaerobacter acetatoxydans Re1]|uniref:Pro-sigmaK processing inhibitor BofA n=1 Tax=Tepidanaerobacter acetatoxydans (strain DSM 21804 / JCM 16047 / Re1) TaxID=1209989 RepID=F4LRY7_TEPAE|nr:pro-sigmaK processing inhibitor BofA family protein [Tepidanaerobacter acetatoxydans]AEE92326.1 pro-sigmaK processing inhibitor BofA [Tepidanaerobacter acetatoxydans Re1]CCP27214.1 Pro-sigmaK processing inhibitor BofA [Tepidanaerobacter acetatoxydans Re1]